MSIENRGNRIEEEGLETLDLFAEELDPKLNAAVAAGCTSTLGSGTSFSCVGGTFCSFGCIACACTSAAEIAG
jgi:hypothetical protein